MSNEVVVLLITVAIPVVGAFLLAGYREWLKFRSKRQTLGITDTELENTLDMLQNRVEQLETERNALRERVQNLETIVTNEAWDALHDSDDSSLSLEASTSVDTETSTERAEKLADRLRS